MNNEVPTVRTIVTRKNTITGVTEILMLKKTDDSKAKGRLELPGGQVENNIPLTTAIDELNQEAGLIIDQESLKMIDEHSYVPDNGSRSRRVITYLTQIDPQLIDVQINRTFKADGTPEDNHQGWYWVSKDTFNKLVEADLVLKSTSIPTVRRVLTT